MSYFYGNRIKDGWEKLHKQTKNKQTNRQADKPTDTTKIMVTWLWIKKYCGVLLQYFLVFLYSVLRTILQHFWRHIGIAIAIFFVSIASQEPLWEYETYQNLSRNCLSRLSAAEFESAPMTFTYIHTFISVKRNG